MAAFCMLQISGEVPFPHSASGFPKGERGVSPSHLSARQLHWVFTCQAHNIYSLLSTSLSFLSFHWEANYLSFMPPSSQLCLVHFTALPAMLMSLAAPYFAEAGTRTLTSRLGSLLKFGCNSCNVPSAAWRVVLVLTLALWKEDVPSHFGRALTPAGTKIFPSTKSE